MARYSIEPITIGDLATAVAGGADVLGDPGVLVRGITQDSRTVESGDLFCCVSGRSFDGHRFIGEALERGAAALLCDQSLTGVASQVPRIQVENVRDHLGSIASRAFGFPAARLRIVGVTGTNGKTSTVAILGSILRAAGARVGMMGTLTGSRTTPEAIDLHARMAAAVNEGLDTIVMEVSSHALDQRRVDGVIFEVAVFTNLGRDHLDYHQTMEAYFAAKARLFTPALSRAGVTNIDDTHGRLLFDAARVPMHPFSRGDAHDASVNVDHVAFTWRGHRLTVPVGGDFTVVNTLAAATAADVLGTSPEAIIEGCATLEPIRGRFETIVSRAGFAVVVDYAHTPEALERVLVSARKVAPGKLIVVFGCGGDRDKGKRPLMGSMAASLADEVVVTSDNPRHEEPGAIISEIVSGARSGRAKVETEPDRTIAIASAISRARHGDIVVIAGKGHESVQEIAGTSVPFDDLEVARGFVVSREEILGLQDRGSGNATDNGERRGRP